MFRASDFLGMTILNDVDKETISLRHDFAYDVVRFPQILFCLSSSWLLHNFCFIIDNADTAGTFLMPEINLLDLRC